MSTLTILTQEQRIGIFRYAMKVLIEGCWGPSCNSDYNHHDCNKIKFSQFYLDYSKVLPKGIMDGFARLHVIQHTNHDCAILCNIFLSEDFPKFMEYFGSEMTGIMDEAQSDEIQNLIYMGLNNETCSFVTPYQNQQFAKEFNGNGH